MKSIKHLRADKYVALSRENKKMKKHSLKSGKEVTIKEAVKEDAQKIIDFYNKVGGETIFLSFGENEFKRDLVEYENFLNATKEEENSIILLIMDDVENIISIASINSSQKPRTKHVGTLGIVIQENYWGLGLGKYLMIELINWAKSNGTTKKIQLSCNEANAKAIDLYKKVGFVEEGHIMQDTFINGNYYNTTLMGLIL